MPESKPRPWWLENREPERPMMPCLDLDEVIAWGRLYEATMITSEDRVRDVCREKGMPVP